jgi:Immunity protein 43
VFNSKKTKEVKFDFLNKRGEYKIVSENFLAFIIDFGINENYETAELDILDLKGNKITSKRYYLLRFVRFDDDLFDFNENNKIPVKGFGMDDKFLYPDLQLKKSTKKEIFVLNNFCYQQIIIFTGKVKERIEKEFYVPEIYNKEMNAW